MMADDGGVGCRCCRNRDIELASLAHEIRILVEVLLMGIQSLMEHPQAAQVRNELGVLAKLAGQGTEALAALDGALDGADEAQNPSERPER
jgi:hypothetical protein